MKKLKQIALGLFCLAMLQGNGAQAAFPIKNEIVTTAQNQTTISTSAETELAQVKEMRVPKKTEAPKTTTSKTIPKGLYIVMSIFWTGWLAMGLNDDFHGKDWIISLILYAIFYIPGLVYSLIKMKKYYK